MHSTNTCRWLLSTVLAIPMLGLGAYHGAAQPTAPADSQNIIVDGSSTTAPVTQAVAAEFSSVERGINISVGVSGTSGGFRRFLPRETDISNASRPIKSSEIDSAASGGLAYVELPVGFDGLTVAVANNTQIFAGGPACLTLGELELIWAREADGVLSNWRQVSGRLADMDMVLSGAAETSGTFDFFNETVSGEAGDTRGDYFGTEEDQLLAERTGATPNELTYFGFAFFQNNQDRVQPVAIDPSRQTIDAPQAVLDDINARRAANGKDPLSNRGGGCNGVAPNVDSIGAFAYALTRPLLIYVNVESAQRPAVQSFVEFYLDEEQIGSDEFMLDVGYIPVGAAIRDAARKCFADRVSGTAFDGSISGLIADDIRARYLNHCGVTS